MSRQNVEDAEGDLMRKMTIKRFRTCEKFTFKCTVCDQENVVASAFRRTEQQAQLVHVLEKCSNKDCAAMPYVHSLVTIQNKLQLDMRRCIRRFYENWLVCDDRDCNANTRNYSHVSHKRILCKTK